MTFPLAGGLSVLPARKSLRGMVVAFACLAGLTAALIPVRSSISTATVALVLVVPVVIGVVSSGFRVGVICIAAGFLVYDFFFIPPYLTLWVSAPEEWATPGIYAAVMLPLARVVAGLNVTRAKELMQKREIRELFHLSYLLTEDRPLDFLLPVLVNALSEVFGARQVALFLPGAGAAGQRMELVAAAGQPLAAAQLRHILPWPGATARVETQPDDKDALTVFALAASGRPVGLLAMSADASARHGREPLLLFANHTALALDRAQLREKALRTRVNAEVADLTKTLVAAVAHDLRAPLASLKASSSMLSDGDMAIGTGRRRSLAAMIDAKTDRLAELIQNLLDMSRIQTGVLRPSRTVAAVAAFIAGVVEDPPTSWSGHDIQAQVPGGMPLIDADLVLMSRVLANLIDNAVRHSPGSAPVTVSAAVEPGGGTVQISVTDAGPGVPAERREEIFRLAPRREHDAGAGLGLTIARTFVEAHGQRIWVADAPGTGARFCFTLSVAAVTQQERAGEESPHH